MELGLIISAFLAGIITFLAPCTLPLVPAYIGFISGVSSDELEDPVKARQARKKIFSNGVMFVLGFSAIFIVFGVLAGLIGQSLAIYRDILGRVGGVLVILFGLFMLGVFKIPFLQTEHRMKMPSFLRIRSTPPSESNTRVFSRRRLNDDEEIWTNISEEERSRLRGKDPYSSRGGGVERILKVGKPSSSFAIGSAFAFGWTPCVGPILGSILLLASTSTTALQGGVLLAVFSLGLAVPFLIIAAVFAQATTLIQKVSKYLKIISIIGGIFLIILGTLLVTNNFSLLIRYGFEVLGGLEYESILKLL